MRQEILLSFLAGSPALADLLARRQDKPPNETPSPIPRPIITSNSSSPNLTPYKLEYFHLGMQYAALELCGLDPYANTVVHGVQPSYCLADQVPWSQIPDLTEVNSSETYDYNDGWFTLRALYTGLFTRGILPEALRDWASKDPMALLGLGNLSDDDKRAIGELVDRERRNVTKTASPPEDMTSARAAEVTAQMVALESWDRHRRSGLSGNTPETPGATFALGAEDKKEVFLVLSSALPQVFGKLGGPRNETNKGGDPKSRPIVEFYSKSPFVGGPNARVLWYKALTPEEMSGAVQMRAIVGWGLWMVILGFMGFVVVL
ncbi:hypothetical protein QBC41DRAFT_32207 [Cercophora samala]|uniref:Uncharacterized protein n=1 Tax=Cercophora samala TaxID=330535 RepID=A0AA39Z0T1_9PEZI|nr:hypothetical protein QBC41DRAFT_32207 [Cercophora samala]